MQLSAQTFPSRRKRSGYPRLGGPQIAEKGRQIATLGKAGFTCSNGWLEKWKSRYNIKQFVISGESGDVDGVTIDSWKERLPELGLDKICLAKFEQNGQPKERSNSASKMGSQFCQKSKMGKE